MDCIIVRIYNSEDYVAESSCIIQGDERIGQGWQWHEKVTEERLNIWSLHFSAVWTKFHLISPEDHRENQLFKGFDAEMSGKVKKNVDEAKLHLHGVGMTSGGLTPQIVHINDIPECTEWTLLFTHKVSGFKGMLMSLGPLSGLL